MIFKNKKDKEMFTLLHPILIMIYADLNYYAKSNFNIDLVVTQTISTLEEDERLKRKSPSHRQSRALDIRTRNLDRLIVEKLVHYINSRWNYKDYHYLTQSGKKRLAYFHKMKGGAEHIHLAIHSKFKPN